MRKLKEHFHRKHGIVSRIFSMEYGTCTCYDCDHGSSNRWCNHCICCEPDNPVVSGQTKYME